ncbi:hypothetical protein [Streptomyces lavendofoliae]|uniref:hypothetical protein n=1 Tax=Streptomyces lavendofoliae TaxID=67314 RepID=UPI003D911E4B
MKDTDGRERPMWRTRWSTPDAWSGDAPFPPVLLVFNRLGERNPNRTVPRLQELTHLWQGQRHIGLPRLRREDCDHHDRPGEPA